MKRLIASALLVVSLMWLAPSASAGLRFGPKSGHIGPGATWVGAGPRPL